MKKFIITILFLGLICTPSIAHAEESEKQKIAESTSYIKTVTTIDKAAKYAYNSETVNWAESYSEKVTEEEYEQAVDRGLELQGSAEIETTYKKMTTAIWFTGGAYQYVNLLHWKIMPKIRSFDIIGIGYPNNVIATDLPDYSQTYCLTDGTCYTSQIHTPKVQTYGASTVFQIYTKSISALDITIWFNVKKTGNFAVTQLYAAGDYSHATTPLSYENAQNYSMSGGGINLGSSISSYYDSIPSAEVYANVNW